MSIGHNRDEAGVVTIVLPDGVPAEALVAGEAKAAGKPVGKRKPASKAAARTSSVGPLPRFRNGPAVDDDGGFFRAGHGWGRTAKTRGFWLYTPSAG